ncbi:MAG: lipoate--protein ligase family protein, partial [Candidatus Omnitrophota bacterium]
MEKVWRLILDEANDPHMNMAIDEAIMMCQAESASSPTLRIYRWLYPCVSIGRFQNLESALNREDNLALVRRPTGGGVVFHNELSFTYSIVYPESSFVLPKGVSNSYREIHGGILQGLRSLGINAALHTIKQGQRRSLKSKFCFSSPCEFDIVCGNRKIAGAAQRRRYGVVLHQGEVSLGLDVW